MNYAIILAGGAGRRLWPASTEACPKQFIDLLGVGRTLLQQTFDRFRLFLPADHILVSTYQDYEHLVREQLPELPVENIVCETTQKSTLSGAARAVREIGLRAPEAAVVVTPCDHFIPLPERFATEISSGLDFVRARLGTFLSMGIAPTNPNTAYGYIQYAKEAEADAEGAYKVKSFSEKPDGALARFFCESGEFLWNTGLFLFSAPTMLALLTQLSSVQGERLQAGCFFQGDAWRDGVATCSWDDEVFEAAKFEAMCEGGDMPRSLDIFLFETCADVRVQACTFGWADVGTWPSLYDLSTTDAHGNFVAPASAEAVFTAAHGNLVRLPEGKRLVVDALNDYVIIDTPSTLFIAPNTDSVHLRRVVMNALGTLREGFVQKRS